MELLPIRVGTNTVTLVGRQHSDAMIRYLQIPLHTFTAGLEVHMVQQGDYALILPDHGGWHYRSTSLGLT